MEKKQSVMNALMVVIATIICSWFIGILLIMIYGTYYSYSTVVSVGLCLAIFVALCQWLRQLPLAKYRAQQAAELGEELTSFQKQRLYVFFDVLLLALLALTAFACDYACYEEEDRYTGVSSMMKPAEEQVETEQGVWSVNNVKLVHLQDSLRYVSDPENLIDPVYEAKCDSLMRVIKNRYGVESAIIVVNRIAGEASQMAFDVINRYGIGDKETNRGLCIIIAYEQHQYFIGTGRGLEADMPDIVCGKLGQVCLVPHLKQEDPSMALFSLCQGIADHLSGKEFVAMEREEDDTVYKAVMSHIEVMLLLTVVFCLFRRYSRK